MGAYGGLIRSVADKVRAQFPMSADEAGALAATCLDIAIEQHRGLLRGATLARALEVASRREPLDAALAHQSSGVPIPIIPTQAPATN